MMPNKTPIYTHQVAHNRYPPSGEHYPIIMIAARHWIRYYTHQSVYAVGTQTQHYETTYSTNHASFHRLLAVGRDIHRR